MSAVRAHEQYSVDELKKMNKQRLEVIDTREARKRKQRERDKKKLNFALFAGFICLIMFALVILVPLQQVISEIYATSYNISELKQKIKKLETKKSDLEAELERSTHNLDDLFIQATALGMKKASDGDYYDLASYVEGKKTSQTEEDKKEAKNSN